MGRRGLIVAACLASMMTPAHAQTSPIVITAAWLRATPKSAPVAGGYATITNKGSVPDRLVAASLPIAAEGQVHSMTMTDGIMHMQRLDNGLAIAPGETIVLSPGANHLMFIAPKAPLKEGQTIAGTMTFEKAGAIPVTFVVVGMAAKSAPGTAPHDAKSMQPMRGMEMPMH